MKRLGWISAAVAAVMALALLGGTGVASAQEDHTAAVKARQALMQINGFFMGQLAGIAKGQVPYDAAQASAIANDMLVLSRMDARDMWPLGSGNDNPALAGKTRALPEIWTTFPAILEKADAMTKALEGLVAAAGTDLASLQGAFGPVGAGCGGCHRSFRAEKF